MSDTLTKARLAELLHSRVGVSKKEAGDLVDEVFGIMRDTLGDGEKVKISGFGNFVVRDKAARRGRNPQTNEEIIIARRRVLTFKPSQVLRAALNEDN
jgi:integration host factor subunit alpha